LLQLAVDTREPRRSLDVERRRDEDLCEHHRGLGEGQLDPRDRQILPKQPAPPEGHQQGDARDRWRWASLRASVLRIFV